MNTFIELNKSTVKMPEHLTGMVSTSAMLSPGMVSTATQTGLDDDDFESLLKASVSVDDDDVSSVASSEASIDSGKTVEKAADPQPSLMDSIAGFFTGGAKPASGATVVDGVPVGPPPPYSSTKSLFGKKSKRKVKKSPKRKVKKSPKRKLYKGSRGGTYYMRKGKKVYV